VCSSDLEDLPPPYVEISLDRLAEIGDDELTQNGAVAARADRRWPMVAERLRALSELERRVVVLAYAREMTLREIGQRVGLSESGVCRVRARALRKLRASLPDDGARSEAA